MYCGILCELSRYLLYSSLTLKYVENSPCDKCHMSDVPSPLSVPAKSIAQRPYEVLSFENLYFNMQDIYYASFPLQLSFPIHGNTE